MVHRIAIYILQPSVAWSQCLLSLKSRLFQLFCISFVEAKSSVSLLRSLKAVAYVWFDVLYSETPAGRIFVFVLRQPVLHVHVCKLHSL